MAIIIRKGANKKEIEKVFSRLHRKKGLDAYKYLGVIKLKEDPLVMQKKVRDEW